MEKYGFTYLWYDRKHKRFYIGSHWGYENDGYICSSDWMKRSYKRRPQDFKRRILNRVTEKKQLNEAEHKWLQQIKKEELGKRYYNLKNHRFGHWRYAKNPKDVWNKGKVGVYKASEKSIRLSAERMKKLWTNPEFRQKHIDRLTGKSYFGSTKEISEISKKISVSNIGKPAWNKGVKGIKKPPRTEEHKKNLSISMKGKKLTEEHKQKLKEAWNRRKPNDHF